jgi:hypothetical protein
MLTAAAAAVLFTTGCAGTPAPAAAPSTPSSSPAAATSSAQASPGVDPACASPELDDILSAIRRYDERGAFDAKARTKLDPDDVAEWNWSLRRLEATAGPELRQAAEGARQVLTKWINTDPGSDEQQLHTVEIGLVATTLTSTCA